MNLLLILPVKSLVDELIMQLVIDGMYSKLNRCTGHPLSGTLELQKGKQISNEQN